MGTILPVVEVLIDPFIIVLILCYGYSIISRRIGESPVKYGLIGVMFGVAVLITMNDPIVIDTGVFVDLRNLFIGVCAGIFGFWAGAIALATGFAMRLYLGGAGVPLGLLGMAVAFAMAMLWRRYIQPRQSSRLLKWAGLGVGIASHIVVALLLPPDLRAAFFTEVAPTLVAFTLAGAIILCGLLETEVQHQQENERAREAAATDPLTNLLNRRSVETAVERLDLPSSQNSGRAMLTFDVDHFKTINDTYGHSVGDAVLQAVTARIRSCLRPGDIFSRLGGDEFLIVLPDIPLDIAHRVSERCRACIADHPVTVGDIDVHCSISMGTKWATKPTTFQEHLAAADSMLYKAKERGRNCVALVASAA